MPVWAEDAMPWLPRLSLATRPLYRAIADAIAEDIASGRLAPNQQLPTQRHRRASGDQLHHRDPCL
ncbi:GntR family transcriptional regulator [Salinicola tamaricis]|uniref:GntR family transcriptional regulator n=1 Tax=Salinicola tamaricis TaxID=1771309 RepID=UPI001A928A6E